MVQTLFEQASHTVRNAVVYHRRIFDVTGLSTSLRRWIFELFRMKERLNDENVIRLFRQPGFFDGFTTINMQEIPYEAEYDNVATFCKGRFVPALVTIFSLNRQVAETISDLELIVCVRCNFDRKGEQSSQKCQLMENVWTLLLLCKNLKRLRFVAVGEFCQPRLPDPDGVYHNFSNPFVASTALEHLSLINTSQGGFTWFPKLWFESIRSLELHGIRSTDNVYFLVLMCCKDTLSSLSVIDNEYNYGSSYAYSSPVPVVLPQLESLELTLSHTCRTVFEAIVEHCPKLTTACVNMKVGEISKTELAALSELSDRLQLRLYLTLVGGSSNISELFKVAGESVLGINVCVGLAPKDYDTTLRCCTNLRSFTDSELDPNTALFFEKLLSDKERAAKLIELDLTGSLPRSMLNALFENCCNLQKLSLRRNDRGLDISKCLKTWVDNGARPHFVHLRNFDRVCPETVCSLLKASGRKLIEIDLMVKVLHENVYGEVLNILTNYCPYVKMCILFDRIISPIYMRSINKRDPFRFTKYSLNK